MIVDRDSPKYPWHSRPADHSQVGLFVDGPKGERNPLAELQAFTHCVVSASTPENERKQLVAYRARASYARIGRFAGPVKPANSGRKRKAA